jgi:prenyltransferase beta subunit
VEVQVSEFFWLATTYTDTEQKKTAEDEVKFNYSISPLGMLDQQVFDGAISSNRYLNSASGRTVSAIAQMALLEALL